jgi:type 2 lantibiotic biosynthesis protein LanM
MLKTIDLIKASYSFERSSSVKQNIKKVISYKEEWFKRNNISRKAMSHYIQSLNISEELFWSILIKKNYISESKVITNSDLHNIFNFNTYKTPVCKEKLSLFSCFHIPFIEEVLKEISPILELFNNKESLYSNIYHQLDFILSEYTTKVLVLEFNILKIRNEFKDNEVHIMLDEYNNTYLTNYDYIHYILQEYPVMTRIIKQVLEQQIHNISDFLKRIINDKDALISTYGELGNLVTFDIGLGDTHKKGKSVYIVHFSNGKIVYKPRNLEIDNNYNKFINWINSKAELKEIKFLKVLNKEAYGYQEFVQYKTCTSDSEIKDFYERQGYSLAIFYILSATDFHYENIIASGAHPIPVDLESLFQNSLEIEYNDTALHKSLEKLNKSVLSTGLIPEYRHIGQQIKNKDKFSAILGGKETFLDKEYYTLHVNDDGVTFKKGKVLSEIGKNNPLYNGEGIDNQLILSHTLKGFRDAYNFFTKYRIDLLGKSSILNNFEGNEARCIIRNTEVYALLLTASNHTDYLQNGIDRELLFTKLWNMGTLHTDMYKLAPFEMKEILEGDVPYFWTYIGSKDIFNRFGTIKDLFIDDAFTKSQSIIKSLNEGDLSFQLDVIEKALVSNMKFPIKKSIYLKGKKVDSINYIENNGGLNNVIWNVLETLYEDMMSKAINNDNDMTWIGVGADNDDNLYYSPLPNNLYDGVMGVGLTFSYLYKVTKNPKYKASTLKILKHHMIFEEIVEKNVSAFHGYGSIAYFYAALYENLGDNEHLEKANTFAKNAMEFLEDDDTYDVLAGTAGLILVLIKLYKLNNNKDVLDYAIKCGDYLLSNKHYENDGIAWRNNYSEKPLSGFSHGSTGIAYALYKLYYYSSQEEYLHAAKLTLNYEDTLYLESLGNWLDVRNNEGNCADFWCHGAPGILLGRALMDISDNSKIEAALKRTLNLDFGNDHSLCHGDAGIIDILLTISRETNYNLEHQINDLATQFVCDIITNGTKSGITYNVNTPNLMLGDAGIILVLLRIIYPNFVKSVLILE